MNTTDITTVFFDIGNVLVGFDHWRIWQGLSQHSSLSPDELQHTIQASGLMNLHETGTLPSHDFFAEVQHHGRLAPSLSYDRFAAIWADIFWEHPAMIELARQITPSYRFGLLSNVGEIHWNWLTHTFPIFREAELHILSFQIGHMKPTQAIYQAALQQAHIRPDQCVYIDDIAEYVQASRQLGMHGLHYQSSAQLRQELTRLQILL